jgi:hypothetical protein
MEVLVSKTLKTFIPDNPETDTLGNISQQCDERTKLLVAFVEETNQMVAEIKVEVSDIGT